MGSSDRVTSRMISLSEAFRRQHQWLRAPGQFSVVAAHRNDLLALRGRSLTALTYLERLGYALRILRPRGLVLARRPEPSAAPGS